MAWEAAVVERNYIAGNGTLVLRCRHHHRFIHEDGWRVRVGEAGEPI